MLKQGPCCHQSQPWAFDKAAFKNCSIYVVGFWGVFRDKVTEKINELSLLELVTGNFNSLLSRKNSLFFFSPDGRHGGLSTVNYAVCQEAPCMKESPKPEDFPVKFPVSREMQ
jgi:hypothetical protein